jgi:UDP-N-acetyl-D-glucosamine dehydrogenase
MNSDLLNKIDNKNVKVGIIGLGYVGLPLVIRFSEVGIETVGFDIDKSKTNKLNNGESYIKHIDSNSIKSANQNGFKATNDFSLISNVDIIIICVPTPLNAKKEPDLSCVTDTVSSIKTCLRENQLLILESTTYPGTTDEKIISVIEGIKFTKKTTCLSIGENFFVGYSPEREDPGNSKYSTKTIPKIVSGYTKNCLAVTKNIYDKIVDITVPVSSIKVAEMTKILENIHRAVNIGLINELKIVADKMDIDIFEVIKAASTKPFGFTPYYPGPGLGGHCIPIDPFYLTWKAKQLGLDTKFIKLAGEVNSSMPHWVVKKALESLRLRLDSILTAKVLIIGVAYKKNLDDVRETPAFKIMELLLKNNVYIEYYDPYIPNLTKTRDYNFKMSSINLTKKKLNEYDLVIIVTDHDIIDYDFIYKNSKCIVDTRGRYGFSEKVIKA